MKTIMIFVLLFLLTLVALGVNILGSIFSNMEIVFISISKFILSIFTSIAYSSGGIITASSNTVSETAKTSIDVANGAFNDVGNLLQGKSIDIALQSSKAPTTNPIPNNLHENKWCFVSKDKCIEMDATDTCSSGKLFSSQAKCLASS